MQKDGFSNKPVEEKVEKAEWEVVEPDETAQKANREPSGNSRTLLHPLAALAMVVLDFGGFAGDVSGFALFFLLPLVMGLIFFVTTFVVAWIQNRLAGEKWGDAVAKGIVAGVLCSIPTPIFGTAVGGFILLKSGLGEFQKGGIRQLAGMFTAKKNS
ncbi:MAG: hypothetical protein V1746_07805 [bacterium]